MIISCDYTYLRVESVVVVAVADRALNSFIAVKLSISYHIYRIISYHTAVLYFRLALIFG
jgi:hypothetical protein